MSKVCQDEEILQKRHEEDMQRLREHIRKQNRKISSLIEVKSNRHTWKIMGFTNEVAKANEWKTENVQSKCFYTLEGYHIRVDLYPSYHGGNFVAIFAQTVTGQFDGDLEWPMKETRFGFHILKKDGNYECHCAFDTTFDQNNVTGPFQKPPHTVCPFGTTNFLSHDDLSTLLISDTITIVINAACEK